MFKRKSLIFFTVVVAMVALFAATDVLAVECDAPECVNLGDCQISIVKHEGKFPLIVDSSNQSDYPEYAAVCLFEEGTLGPIGLPCAIFPYKFAPDCKYSQLAQAIPNPGTYCPDDAFVLTKTSSIQEWKPAGAGDTDTKWYVDDFSVRVLEFQQNLDGMPEYFIATTANVSAHPAPILLKQGKNLYYNTLLSCNCWVPPPPVDVSGVSTSTPEGCTLTVNQTETGPIAVASCPNPDGGMSDVPVSVFDTADLYLGIPIPSDGTETCDCTFDGQCLALERFKHLSDQAYGRVGEESTCWYYWNGKWYSYSY